MILIKKCSTKLWKNRKEEWKEERFKETGEIGSQWNSQQPETKDMKHY